MIMINRKRPSTLPLTKDNMAMSSSSSWSTNNPGLPSHSSYHGSTTGVAPLSSSSCAYAATVATSSSYTSSKNTSPVSLSSSPTTPHTFSIPSPSSPKPHSFLSSSPKSHYSSSPTSASSSPRHLNSRNHHQQAPVNVMSVLQSEQPQQHSHSPSLSLSSSSSSSSTSNNGHKDTSAPIHIKSPSSSSSGSHNRTIPRGKLLWSSSPSNTCPLYGHGYGGYNGDADYHDDCSDEPVYHYVDEVDLLDSYFPPSQHYNPYSKVSQANMMMKMTPLSISPSNGIHHVNQCGINSVHSHHLPQRKVNNPHNNVNQVNQFQKLETEKGFRSRSNSLPNAHNQVGHRLPIPKRRSCNNIEETEYQNNSNHMSEEDEEKRRLEELEITESAFKLFDKNGDGVLSEEELYIMLKGLGSDMTMSSLKELVSEICCNSPFANGITFKDFFRVLQSSTDTATMASSVSSSTGSTYDDVIEEQEKLARQKQLEQERKNRKWHEKLRDLLGIKTKKQQQQSNNFQAPLACTKYNHNDLKLVFQVFDSDGDGLVSMQEIQSIINDLGLDVVFSEEELAELIGSVDKDKDNRITYNEFCALLST